MSKIRKIGLKYCGGCSARYDRIEQDIRFKEELIQIITSEKDMNAFITALKGENDELARNLQKQAHHS